MRTKYTESKLFGIAHYMIDNNATFLEVGKKFELSKTTIHRYMSVLLPEISLTLHRKVTRVMEHNRLVARLKGCEAMKMLKVAKNNNIGG